MARARPGTVAVFVLGLPVVVGLFVYGPFVADLLLHRRPPSRFLIPTGYVGWVTVQYQVSDAPPLAHEGKYLVVPVDREGKLQTSSNHPEGWAHDQFFYYSERGRHALSNAGWCKGGMIWGDETGKGAQSVIIQKFFVGSEDQFRSEVDPAGKTYSPCG